MEQVSGQERKSRNTAAEELSDNIETIEKTASVVVKGEREAVYCLSVIGQIEGHYLLPEGQKATKYEQLIPLLVSRWFWAADIPSVFRLPWQGGNPS